MHKGYGAGWSKSQEPRAIAWMGRQSWIGISPQLGYSLAQGYGSYRVDNNIQLFSSVASSQYHANGDALYHGHVSRHVSNAIDDVKGRFRAHPLMTPSSSFLRVTFHPREIG